MQESSHYSRSRLLAIRKPEKGNGAFTVIELLVVIAIIAILASMIFPAISQTKGRGHRVQCASNLGQLSLALMMYADESDDEYPRRATSSKSNWLAVLRPYYIDTKILRCRIEDPSVPASYLLNSFNDWFRENLSPWDYITYESWRWPHGLKTGAIKDPSGTIVFGEKLSTSSHVHMDLLQNGGNDLEQIDHRRHAKGSNFAFADGSVRWLRQWNSVHPINLWAITEKWRASSSREP